jgi:hypothetical protein
MESPKFGREMEGRKLRLFFPDGTTDIGVIVSAPSHDDCKGCDGFVYDLVSTDRPARCEAMGVQIGSALWTRFEDLEKYEIMEG